MASIGQLAAGVAHEINNPISFVSSNLSTLQKYIKRFIEYNDVLAANLQEDKVELTEAVKEKLRIDFIKEDTLELITESIDGAERVSTIVHGLKRFSRIEDSDDKPVDLRECMDSAINLIWNELKYKATITKKYGDISETKGKGQLLNQVFMNLLINASHSIDTEGEIAINIWQENAMIFVAISDNGCGIAQENLGRLFDPFFTTKDVGKGTGLGLSISYEIIQNHAGDITVESKIDKGSTFTVTIPVRS